VINCFGNISPVSIPFNFQIMDELRNYVFENNKCNNILLFDTLCFILNVFEFSLVIIKVK